MKHAKLKAIWSFKKLSFKTEVKMFIFNKVKVKCNITKWILWAPWLNLAIQTLLPKNVSSQLKLIYLWIELCPVHWRTVP